jgi:ATP-dependent RNA helicase DBP3
VRRLASSFLNEPVRVTVGSEDLTANTRIEQSIEIFDNPRDKECVRCRCHFLGADHTSSTRLLKQLQALKHPKTSNPSAPSRLIVFALYKKEAARVEGLLSSKGYAVMCLQGDMSQAGRLAALQAFKEGSVNTLVATDVAARGLDIPDVGVVLNYSFPLTIEDYVHRIGRTGRGGKSGRSITFFTGDGHEKALAGEFARLLDNAGVDCAEMRKRFPMTIKKKTHSVYGAHFRDE